MPYGLCIAIDINMDIDIDMYEYVKDLVIYVFDSKQCSVQKSFS